MMKLKELESWLQDITGFENPKVKLEQYETPAHIAARMVHTMESSFGDLQGKLVADLGCGCGMLAIGTVMMGAAVSFGFDIESEALQICQENIEEMEVPSIELIQTDVKILGGNQSKFHKFFDTVVLNPPFGTKHNHGSDMEFLKVALDISKTAVYSLHKTATRAHITKKAADWGVKMQVLAQLRYDLPSTYKFHKKKSIDIEVDFIRFSHK
ncbi:rRNA N6-adenosine-methyltransferase METTL5-like [Penaeus japonicus]|uniref:rRNA N6-adenosine-methyltransferase METTL5-like n=1 Tax=Penaeus japonicus TaxID=27405 RepID=UPI001C70E3F4|nr:rRNA N6-adenosine-methyltransferase METTL5-like [Penaeus japonicus]